jgi:hypothetical protein
MAQRDFTDIHMSWNEKFKKIKFGKYFKLQKMCDSTSTDLASGHEDQHKFNWTVKTLEKATKLHCKLWKWKNV